MPAKEFGLSAHADQPGLIEYACRMRPKHIALVHGEPNGQRELRQRLLTVLPKAEIDCGPPDLSLP
jgi:Cft2 family RNA processing exonuclease